MPWAEPEIVACLREHALQPAPLASFHFGFQQIVEFAKIGPCGTLEEPRGTLGPFKRLKFAAGQRPGALGRLLGDDDRPDRSVLLGRW